MNVIYLKFATSIKGGHSTCSPRAPLSGPTVSPFSSMWCSPYNAVQSIQCGAVHTMWCSPHTVVQSIKSQERAVLCLLVERLSQNSISYLHKWTRLRENTEPVLAALQYNFLLLLITKSRLGSAQVLTKSLIFVRTHPDRAFCRTKGAGFCSFRGVHYHTHTERKE
jgi:hypothetical protein